MKKLNVVFIVVISFIIISVLGRKVIAQNQNVRENLIHKSSIKGSIESNQMKRTDTSIILTIPPVTCGRIPWNDPIIINWLSENNEGTGTPGSSKYKFSGWVSNFDKSWKLKVIITTNQDWSQPVTLDADGRFDGVVFLDDHNRDTTPIKITIKNSSGTIIKKCIITLTE